MALTFVWFDLGYTLVDRYIGRLYQNILSSEYQIQKTVREVELAFHCTDKLFMREYPGVLGQKSSTYFLWYIGVVNHFLGIAIDLENVVAHFRQNNYFSVDIWKAYPHTRDTLLKLKREGYGVGLISNWDLSARQVLQDNLLDDLFDEVVVSAEVGVEKPSSKIFKIALDKQKLKSEECLYVGDNYYDDVIGSRKVGMDCLLINRFGTTGIEELSFQAVIEDVTGVLPWCRRKQALQ